MGKGSEEDIHIIIITNGFAHGSELFTHISHVREMSVYTVILPASGIPEPLHEIHGQSMHLLLVDPLERCPGPLCRGLCPRHPTSRGDHTSNPQVHLTRP